MEITISDVQNQTTLFLIILGTGYGWANFHRSSMSILSPYLIDNLDLSIEQVGFLVKEERREND